MTNKAPTVVFHVSSEADFNSLMNEFKKRRYHCFGGMDIKRCKYQRMFRGKPYGGPNNYVITRTLVVGMIALSDTAEVFVP